MKSWLVSLVILLTVVGCTTTSQTQTRLLNEQMNMLTARLQQAECRVGNLERKTANLEARDRQLAMVVVDLLYHKPVTKSATEVTTKTPLKSCLLACEQAKRVSGPVDDRWVIINCGDVAECNDPPPKPPSGVLDDRK